MTQVFGPTKDGNSSQSRYSDYRTWGNALYMLVTSSTGEGWNGVMHDYMIEYPRCTDNNDYLNSDCGSVPWALGLFISWNLLSM